MCEQWCDVSLQDAKHYFYHKISVSTVDKKENAGWVYTVDPITRSIVLYLDGQLTTVIGRAVSSVTILEKPTEKMKFLLDSLFKEKTVDNVACLKKLKDKLVLWLQQNRFPVEVVEDKILVANVLEILPPYTSQTCHTSNEIILGRIQKLIDTLPA